MITLYGIKNCSSVKKAQIWLDEHQLSYLFFDYKKTPPTHELLLKFTAQLNWQDVLNKKGTTWRKLDDNEKNAVIDKESAIAVMLKYPSSIKRPIIEYNNQYLLGINETTLAQFFHVES